MNWVQRIVRILLSHWSKVHVQNGIPFSSVFLGKQSSNIKWIDVACKSEVCMMWFHQSQLEFKFSQSHTHILFRWMCFTFWAGILDVIETLFVSHDSQVLNLKTFHRIIKKRTNKPFERKSICKVNGIADIGYFWILLLLRSPTILEMDVTHFCSCAHTNVRQKVFCTTQKLMEQKQKENEDDNDEEEKEQVFSEFRS